MIQANELRVGNLVEKDGEYYVADFITIQMAHNYNPISLTPEILVKLPKSFDFAENFTAYTQSDGIYVEQYGEGREKLLHIDALHKYQNLYFALTGIELEIKL